MDALVNAMGNNASRIIIDKTSIANTAAGQYHSLWRALGYPGQGAIPTTAAVASNSTLGALGFTQQTAPATSYFANFEAIVSTAGMTVEIHDRLMHMGGLSGTNTGTQTVNLDIDANLATSNLSARKGDANYSDVQWWLEWYADTGVTVTTITVNVTFNDGTTSNLVGVIPGGTVRASRMIPLNGLIASADSGKYIRDVNSLSLTPSTTGAGNFGVTATRYRGAVFCPIANARMSTTWADLGLPEIFNNSCLFPIIIANTTASGILRGTGKIIHG